jgi:exodeoxyribonuclease VII large subunit
MIPEPIAFADYQKSNLTPVELPILSVTDLSLSLKQLVESQFKRVRVRGEVSGFKRHTSGHAYFTLKDQDAVIDAVCWRGTSLKTLLEDGIEIIVTGRLTTYPGRSKYQIVVEGAEVAGEGALLKLLLERKARLQAEGLFDCKRRLPTFPGKIGIITSPTGAVIQDILHRLNDRYPCEVLVWPVLVQGPGAAEQITAAIEGFNDLPANQQPDLLIVARGGGSLEDLWCFNEENVVRAAANSHIPLISAVGHETDVTLIDWASDLRAPTPTAAAELATPVLSQIKYTLVQYGNRLYNYVQRQLQNDDIHLTNLGRALPSPQQILEQTMLRLDDWADRLYQAKDVFLSTRQQTLAVQLARLRSPNGIIEKGEYTLTQVFERLVQGQYRFLQYHIDQLNWKSASLEQNSYQRILDRGFCLVSSDKEVVNSVQYFNKNPVPNISLRFADGEVKIKPEVLAIPVGNEDTCF